MKTKKARWYMWVTGALLLGAALSVLIGGGCNRYVAMLPADFDRVQRIVEGKVSQLAPECGVDMQKQPLSIQRWSVWYEDRRFRRDLDPGKRARYYVEATRHDGIEDVSRVRCEVEIRKVKEGVRLRCSGKPWSTSLFSFESGRTQWYGPHFIKEVKEEVPCNPDRILWGKPANGVKLGVILGGEQGTWWKTRSMLIYLQNVTDEPLHVCCRMEPLARRITTKHHDYVLDLAYVDEQGNSYSGVPQGDEWAFGIIGDYQVLEPGSPLLIGRGGIRLGYLRGKKEYDPIRPDALAVGTYRLLVTLKTTRREGEIPPVLRARWSAPPSGGDEKIRTWEGSVEAATDRFTWAGKPAL